LSGWERRGVESRIIGRIEFNPVCLIGVTLLGSAQAQAQVVSFGVPVYPAPVYAAPIYAAPVYPMAVYPTSYYSVPAYSAYYPAPAPVYAAPAPYAVAAPVVVGAPVYAYGHWGRHHATVHYRW
jgi:hypothetical protein